MTNVDDYERGYADALNRPAETIADLQKEIGDLRNAYETMTKEIELLRTALGAERASHCVCKCDDDGNFVSQCLAHKEVENERDRLRAALRPFAEAYRLIQRNNPDWPNQRWASMDMPDLARAAELVPWDCGNFPQSQGQEDRP